MPEERVAADVVEDLLLESCVGCCTARDGNVPNCRECRKGGLILGGTTEPPKVDWEFYRRFRDWVRANGGRHPAEYTAAVHKSLTVAGFLSQSFSNAGNGHYLLFDGLTNKNPYDEFGILYFVKEEDANGYAAAMGFQEYPVFHSVTILECL